MEFLSLHPWWSFFIILTIILSYIGFCAHLHIQNRAVFFYSYRDVTIIFLTPVILIALSYLIKNKEILSACILCITLIAFSWAWIITYRSNTKRFFLSLLIVWGKLLLSAIVWAILAISLGLAVITGNSKRKKYERRDRHAERNEKAFIGALLVGFELSRNLLNLCCLHKDFSTPSKNIEVNRS